MTFTHALATNNYGPAKFIVDSSAANGTHTTIASALTAASSGDTIFIRQGTYTENITLKAGVNLCAFGPAAGFYTGTSGKAIISGTCTMTTAGTVGINGLVLQTNSAAALAVTGSAASIVILQNCYLNCTNNTGVTFSTSSSSARIQFEYCEGDLGTTGIALFAHSSAGNLRLLHSSFGNTGGSSTNNTVSAGSFTPNYSSWGNGTTLSNAAAMTGDYLDMTMSGNQTALTTSNTSTANIQFSTITSGTSSVISVGSGTTVSLHYCFLSSSNASTVAGTGTLSFTNITGNSTFSLAAGLTLSNASTNSFMSGAGVGTSGQTLTSNGSSSPPTWQTASSGGTFVKQVRANTNTSGSTTTAIPYDDTIPQNTEGAQVLTVAITPANTNNILLIEYSLNMTCVAHSSITRQWISALFQDSTANAIYAQLDFQTTVGQSTSNTGVSVYGRYYMTAGTTSSTTFKLRVGPGDSAYTYYWLSDIGTDVFSTVNRLTLTVTEYSA